MDGAKVNTTEGWREIRGLVLCKREAGKPADLRHWDDRALPAPSACWSWASVTDADATGKQLQGGGSPRPGTWQARQRCGRWRGLNMEAVA